MFILTKFFKKFYFRVIGVLSVCYNHHNQSLNDINRANLLTYWYIELIGITLNLARFRHFNYLIKYISYLKKVVTDKELIIRHNSERREMNYIGCFPD